MSLECNEDCSIAYHLTCWRKYKTECEQKTDKEFLLTACATPDCCGFVSVVVVYDNKGGIKAKVRRERERRKRGGGREGEGGIWSILRCLDSLAYRNYVMKKCQNSLCSMYVCVLELQCTDIICA